MQKKLSSLFSCLILCSTAVLGPTSIAQAKPVQLSLPIPNSLDEETQQAMFFFMSKTDEGYKKAFQILSGKIEKDNNAFANQIRATMYYKGLGVPESKELALNDFQAAADESPSAAYMAGYMSLFGDGVPIDIESGAEYMKLAADNGQADAQYQLAKLSYDQSKVEQIPTLKLNEEKSALHYGTMCAKQKNPECMLILADIFESGMAGVKVSKQSAQNMRELAEKQPLNH